MMIQITWKLSTTTRGHFIISDKYSLHKIWFDYKTYGYYKVINEYDLILFTLRSNQAGTYKCKAVSLSDPKKNVTLSERTVNLCSRFLSYLYSTLKRKNTKKYNIMLSIQEHPVIIVMKVLTPKEWIIRIQAVNSKRYSLSQ